MRHTTLSVLLLLWIFPNCIWQASAAFEPINLTTNSFNRDIVVEKEAPTPVVPVTTATMESGSSNSGFSWFERGYLPEWPAAGFPEAGSVLTSDQASDHQYQMPLSYHASNGVLLDSAHTNVAVYFTSPTNVAALSFLTSSGGTRNIIRYTVFYDDNSRETGTFISPNWYDDGNPAWAANGRVNVGTFVYADLNSYNPRLYSVDISLSNSISPIIRLDLSLASGSGHTALFAISGSPALGEPFVPIAIQGFNEDMVVEADAVKPGFLDYNTTATMENGSANTKFTWYEKGYFPPAPETGLPEPGSMLTSESATDHWFVLPPSYQDSNGILLDIDNNNCVLTLATPDSYSALSFLTASAHGPGTNQCVINYADATSETNCFISPDWMSNSNSAFTAHGRVSVNTKLTSNVNSNTPSLFAVDIPLAKLLSSVTNIILSPVNPGPDVHCVVFALSGVRTTNVPPMRPVLSIIIGPDSGITLRTTHAGRLQSSGALFGPDCLWIEEGPISESGVVTAVPQNGVRFYRALAQ
jgi:hypothetical protein